LEGVRLNQALEGVKLQVKSEEVGANPKMRSGPSNTKSFKLVLLRNDEEKEKI
jgi:hypothetical protein